MTCIEVDPLVPEAALGHFILDGQRYHGHDITIVWDCADARAPRIAMPTVARDWTSMSNGRLAASASRLSMLRVNLGP